MKTKPTSLTPYVALLRGINVGGKNMLPMADLAKMFVTARCTDVRTFIQSGNVIFNATPDLAGRIAEVISAQIARKFGCKIPVVLRSARQIEETAVNNPFIKAGAPEEMLHVMFLADLPKSDKVAQLDAKRSPPDEFIVRGQEIFLKLPNGAARTKLTNAYFDSKLATISTGRNWRTVLKLLELVKA
ncbi:MAG TPA: DUF1697 domain-containing protein [Verrucomicrobiae bacterium]|nr:DUF1697 domain-containing protein [Verrucomicrobiae bacterium]